MPETTQQDLYQLVLDNVSVGVFTVNTDFKIISFNRAAEKLTGFTREEALGRRCYEIFRADMCFTDNCALKKAIDTHRNKIEERVRILSKSNDERPVQVTASVLKDPEGSVLGGVETFIDDRARSYLEKRVEDSYCFEDIIGRDRRIKKLFEILPALADSDTAILILGETGTGKDLVARAVHNASRRHKGPMVKVNCAALPENLLESELFGYKKGAFTDAKKDKPGRFQLAEGGTIFLDEIGDMPLSLQAKLLQVLEDKEFFPLGATAPIKVDARVLASTNRDLSRMVEQGEFRADLYFRLKVALVEVPPLRERPSDIMLIANHFLDEFSSLEDKNITGFSPEAVKVLMEYDYPGNVRELRNIVEYATLLRPSGTIGSRDLPPYLFQEDDGPRGRVARPGPASSGAEDELLDALEECAWNRQEAARRLGVSRTTLWRRMKRRGFIEDGR